jgi:hypothetical protein
MELVIHDPEQVDLMPELVFQATRSQEELCQIQVTFTECAAAQTRICSEEQKLKNHNNSLSFSLSWATTETTYS